MSQIIKPVMLDETGQTTNQKIDNLNTQITQALGTLSTNINTTLTQYAEAQEGTLSGFASDINTTMSNLANDLVGVLVSLKSVNGKYGAVILDSGDIVISKSVSGSKTISQILSEMQEAIAKTPLTFGMTQIVGTDDDYTLTITQGTPS